MDEFKKYFDAINLKVSKSNAHYYSSLVNINLKLEKLI